MGVLEEMEQRRRLEAERKVKERKEAEKVQEKLNEEKNKGDEKK